MSLLPSNPAASSQVEEFFDKGFIIVSRLFNSDEVALMHRVLAEDISFRVHAFPRVDGHGAVAKIAVWNHPGSSVFGIVARSARIVNPMQLFLGGEVYHYHSKITLKEPLVGGVWDWHQDYAYWYHNGCLFPSMANAFVAINPATRKNGCLEIVPRSHIMGRIDHVALDNEGNRFSVDSEELAKNTRSRVVADPERVASAVARLGTVYCEMEPGDVCFFHGNTLHRSGPNRSSERRAALICVYNTAWNSPIRPHHHPSYTPLVKMPDSALLEHGFNCADGSEQFLSHPADSQ